ncbi:MAG: gliding motility-associated C-terminal domain-containing protein, partial [Flavobacteriales bacterium]|nr:gliding motility-associated C-terminal domain-containing protein [Flavobacteriales bacterium]
IVLLLSVGSLSAQNYLGTDFRVAFMKNIDPTFNGTPIFEIVVLAEDQAEVTVSYGQPADAFFQEQTATIPAGELNSFVFNTGEFLNQEQVDIIETRSFHVISDTDVRVYGVHNRAYFAEATSVLPTSALGEEYLVMSFNDGYGTYPSLISIIATEDDTEVSVTPSSPTLFGGTGDEFQLTLDAGEVITISSSGDLTGSLVVAEPGKPIAVFGGQQQGLIGESICSADSHIFDQVLAVGDLGTLYSVMPVDGSNSELMRILGTVDGTEVFVGCELLTTLDSGEVYEEYVSTSRLINSSDPVAVAMYTVGLDCSGLNTGDPNMRTLLPLDQASNHVAFATENQFIFPEDQFNFLHVVSPTADIGNITLNGSGVSAWQTFPSSPDLSYVQLEISPITTEFELESSSPFWSEYIAMNFADVMSFNLGATTTMDIPSIGSDLVNLGPDFALCPGETAILDPGLGESGTWQDGSISETFLIDQPGIYSVQIDGACASGFDEVLVTEGLVPSLELEGNYAICGGESTEIGIEGDDNTTYEWNNGETDPMITVSNPGTYTLTATSIDGCTSESQTQVSQLDNPMVEIDGLEEICPNETLDLTALGSQGNFVWNDGTIGSVLSIENPGTYSVTFTDDSGCSSEASIVVQPLQDPIVLPFDGISFCEGKTVDIILDSPNATVIWLQNGNEEILSIDASGIYEYEASNSCGTLQGQIEVIADDCTCPVYVPNAFTPNADGLNDLFIPEIGCPVENYRLRVFNRWGSEIFASSDPEVSWNGSSSEQSDYFAPDGVYYYVLEFDNNLTLVDDREYISGSITLIR